MKTVERSAWGARAPRSTLGFADKAGLTWHWYGAMIDTRDHANCIHFWKQAQDQHMAPGGLGTKNGAWDIAYNLGYCNHGFVFIGRGWDARSGANGTDTVNASWLAVCWIGGTTEPLSNDAREAAKEIRAEASRRGFRSANEPHNRFYQTQCPGSTITGMIKNLSVPEVSQEIQQSQTIVLGSPALVGQDRYQVEVMTMEMPVVQQGSTGQYVRICQGLLIANGRSVTVDGDFGPATFAALRDWQAACGLNADGVAGPITWRRLLCI